MCAIQISDLHKKYHRKEVLKGITCTLENGVYGLLGPNGAGKTTLMRCITGLCSYEGSIKVNDTSIGKSKIKIGYLPQNFNVYRELTVWEMMQYFCNLKKIPRKKRQVEMERCLSLVHLENEKNTQSCKLSGGMLRRLGIAQAILGSPDLIILDEPTAGLDPEERLRFSGIINRLEKNCIVIISTHIVEDVEACCEKIIVMNQGNIIKLASLDEIRKCAEKKVIEMKTKDVETISPEKIVVIEKEYQRESVLYQRIITVSPQVDSLNPTVEDGYLYILHQ